MTARSWGLSTPRGHSTPPGGQQRNSIHPLPAQSLRDDPMLDTDREIVATVFVIGYIAFVVALFTVCVGIIKLCE